MSYFTLRLLEVFSNSNYLTYLPNHSLFAHSYCVQLLLLKSLRHMRIIIWRMPEWMNVRIAKSCNEMMLPASKADVAHDDRRWHCCCCWWGNGYILKLKTSHADEKYDRHDSDNLNRFVIHTGFRRHHHHHHCCLDVALCNFVLKVDDMYLSKSEIATRVIMSVIIRVLL